MREIVPMRPTDQRVLAYWRDYRAAHGRSPTIREAVNGIGIAYLTLERSLDRLVSAGAMRHRPSTRRGYEVATGETFAPNAQNQVRGHEEGGLLTA